MCQNGGRFEFKFQRKCEIFSRPPIHACKPKNHEIFTHFTPQKDAIPRGYQAFNAWSEVLVRAKCVSATISPLATLYGSRNAKNSSTGVDRHETRNLLQVSTFIYNRQRADIRNKSTDRRKNPNALKNGRWRVELVLHANMGTLRRSLYFRENVRFFRFTRSWLMHASLKLRNNSSCFH